MGGIGSGRYYRWQSKKPTVEDALTINLSRLKWKWGVAHSGDVVWSHNGEKIACIGYRLDTLDDYDPKVTFSYTRNDTPYKYDVQLAYTTPHYGGKRLWFICPLVTNNRLCNRRVSKLYLPSGASYFGCRHCYQLAYQSQNETDYDRLMRKAWKVQRRLQGDTKYAGNLFFTPRPKGMHEKTYRRLHNKMTRLSDTGTTIAFGRFGVEL